MKHSIAGLTVLLAALPCSAVTITFRDGRALVCDILAKDDTNLIVRTVKGVQTNTWRQLAPASFKAVHPDLYARLLAEAKARQQQHAKAMQAKGLIKVGGRWVDKQTYQARALSFLRLRVACLEDRGHYVEGPRGNPPNKNLRVKSRDCRARCTIGIDGMQPATPHVLRVVYSCVVTDQDKIRKVLDHDLQFVHTICGPAGFQTNVHSSVYTQGEEITRFKVERPNGSGYSTRHSKRKTGYSLLGWDINIWLDDLLVYERRCDGTEQYYHLRK